MFYWFFINMTLFLNLLGCDPNLLLNLGLGPTGIVIQCDYSERHRGEETKLPANENKGRKQKCANLSALPAN